MSERQYITDALFLPPRARSPLDDGAGGDRKRRRKVLSCYDCRRRKLQCDRVMPACGRCSKAGQSSSCTYLEEATEIPDKTSKCPGPDDNTNQPLAGTHHASTYVVQSDQPAEDLLSKLKRQERRIEQLEAALGKTSRSAEHTAHYHHQAANFPLTPASLQGHELTSGINDRETMLLRGKSFKTQFSGTTHPLAMIAHIPELNLFTKEALETYPSFQQVKYDIGNLEARIKCADRHYVSLADEDLHTLLPPRSDVDQAVRQYLESYERIYHIMHVPSFWQAYEDMWQVGIANAPRHILVTVLLMISSVSCVAPKQPWSYVANSSSAREKAIVATQVCESWINRQSQKRVSAADFQIRFLLCLTKQTTARKVKRTWTEVGTLLRFCMSAGLHRNPDLIRKSTTPLEKELRRRIWAAVVDFELQASFDRGMMSAPWLFQSDTPGPSNVEDGNSSSEHMPPSVRETECTDAWYLSKVNDTAALRCNLNSVLNNIRHVLTFEEVKQYTDEIEAQLRSIPQVTLPDYEEVHSLLSLKLLQYLLALHNRFLRSGVTSSERMFSMMTVLETASKVVAIHQKLHLNEKRALQFLGYDLLRVALSVANVVSVQTSSPGAFLANIGLQHSPLILQAIEMLADKAARLGCEQRQLWVALAAQGFVKSRQDVSQRPLYMKEAVDVITQVYYKMMASQENGPLQVSNSGTSFQPPISRGIVDYLPMVAGEPDAPEQEVNPADSTLFDFEDFAAWTFEDWMFDSGDPSLTFDAS